MKFSAERVIGFGFVIGLLIMLIAGLLSFINMQQLLHGFQASRRIRETISIEVALLDDLQESESGERGYVITGNRAFLQDYTHGLDMLSVDLPALNTQPVIEKREQSEREHLQFLIHAKLAFMEGTVKLRKRYGLAAAIRRTQSGIGKDSMDRIRQLIAQLERMQEIALLAQQHGAGSRTKTTTSAILAECALSFALAPIALLMIRRDLRERKRFTDALLEAKNSAEAANRAKSNFLAAMSHEIRTPMNGVIGMTLLLLETDLTEKQRQFAESMRVSGAALLEIINNILDFSKIESGKVELNASPFDLHELIEEALETVAARETEKRIELLYRIDPSVTPGIRTDAGMLRQILLNLVGNAVKFTERGEVCVEVRATSPLPSRTVLKFSVRDTGIGISEAESRALFQPFTQVDATLGRKHGGTGLGLAISSRLVDRMGGRIWFESAPGQGSTFHFTVPVSPAFLPSRVPLEKKQPELDGKRVLIVDENRTRRGILTGWCRDWGMVCRSAASPREALGWIDGDEKFDLALVDQDMAGMSGATFGIEVQRRSAGSHLPMILFCRLNDRTCDLKEVRAFYPQSLLKPLKKLMLLKAVLKICGEGLDSSPIFESKRARAPSARKLRILVTEDNPINQRVAVGMLGNLGYTADTAATGLEAMEALRRNRYDLVFMDLQLPEMDGIETTRRIHAEFPPEQCPPIIAMTANALRGERERCLQAGMDDYMAKPISLEALGQQVERWSLRVPSAAQAESVDNTLNPSQLEELMRLRDALGPRVLRETLLAFFEQTPLLLEKMRTAAKAGDLRTVTETAHRMQGSCLTMAASHMANLCQEIKRTKIGDWAGVEGLLDRLSRSWMETRGSLERVLDNPEQAE